MQFSHWKGLYASGSEGLWVHQAPRQNMKTFMMKNDCQEIDSLISTVTKKPDDFERERKIPWVNLPLYHVWPGQLLAFHSSGTGVLITAASEFCFALLKTDALVQVLLHRSCPPSSPNAYTALAPRPAVVHLQCGHYLCLKCTDQRQVDGPEYFFLGQPKKGEPNTNEKYMAPEITFAFYL